MNAITLDPILDVYILLALGVVILVLGVDAVLKAPRGAWFRLSAALIVWASLFNPQVTTKDTQPLKDIVLVLVDKSSSQNLQDRMDQTEQALAHIKEQTALYSDLDIRFIDITADGKEDKLGTRAIRSLKQALSGIDPKRYGGAILISDGQIHDMDETTALPGPLHVLLSGHKKDQDRRLEIIDAPRYGLVDQNLKIRVRVLDNGVVNPTAPVRLVKPDGSRVAFKAAKDGIFESNFIPKHAGDTVLVVETDPMAGEISLTNNKFALSINGVRDRLRVLLVSGLPHQGQRTWRNILRSDPAVDLVHFTILRPSEKEDFTPLTELSLIAFPVRELFEEKLHDFDLIIFDRYYKHNVLSEGYFENINDYVREGGALLISAGPDFSGPRSLAHTKLANLLPVKSTGQVQQDTPYRIKRTQIGKRHPITSQLAGSEKDWGRWMRLIQTGEFEGQTILESDDKQPLLIVNRIEEGRVAMLMSDHVWLWARGFDGGGPHSGLVRHVVHWLMKEPDLDEEKLTLQAADNAKLAINRQSLSGTAPDVTLTRPDDTEETIKLKPKGNGQSHLLVDAAMPGIYRASDGDQSAVTTVGSANPKEFLDPRATEQPLKNLIDQTGGSLHWIDDGLPLVKRVSSKGNLSGKGWLGLPQNRAEAVIGSKQTPLLPAWLIFLTAMGLWSLGWWRESR
ncbi:hypothetical protein RYZ26_02315 [Terasakiella sp. A23]|uniref:DUF7408 domain-containing protein n=1 Tax=Terasakiella sp. FCG-A23 TaxID=3080561 RepID=UPI002953B9A2|nr:hypothetical protein [Terasakiella sp. A23]MDV7338414.1 hypothetical protein [Terasakiella sp. A23]